MATKISYNDVKAAFIGYKNGSVSLDEFTSISKEYIGKDEDNKTAVARLIKSDAAGYRKLHNETNGISANEQSTDNTGGQQATEPEPKPTKPRLTKTSEDYAVVLENLAKGEVSLDDVTGSYAISKTLLAELTKIFK